MKEIGDKWEIIAMKYLLSKWYKILESNFKYSTIWEVDIIAKTWGTTVFIEVKYRKNSNFWAPEEFVDKKKLDKFYQTLLYYCDKNAIDIDEEDIRIDIISIDKSENKLKHFTNISLEY